MALQSNVFGSGANNSTLNICIVLPVYESRSLCKSITQNKLECHTALRKNWLFEYLMLGATESTNMILHVFDMYYPCIYTYYVQYVSMDMAACQKKWYSWPSLGEHTYGVVLKLRPNFQNNKDPLLACPLLAKAWKYPYTVGVFFSVCSFYWT